MPNRYHSNTLMKLRKKVRCKSLQKLENCAQEYQEMLATAYKFYCSIEEVQQADRDFRSKKVLFGESSPGHNYPNLQESVKFHKNKTEIIRCFRSEKGRIPACQKDYQLGYTLTPSFKSDRTCIVCMSVSEKPLHGCAHCCESRYCSKECQRKHWPDHKVHCAEVRKTRLKELKRIATMRPRSLKFWSKARIQIMMDAGVPILDFCRMFWDARKRKSHIWERLYINNTLLWLFGQLTKLDKAVFDDYETRLKIRESMCSRIISRFFRQIRIRKLSVLSKDHKTFYTTAPTDVLMEIRGFL